MKNLWIFGDSMSAPFTNLITNDWFKLYLETAKIDKFPFWQEIVSEKLNLNLIDTAKGGLDNYTIFETFCENSINIQTDDIIILNWSNITRFRVAVKDNSFPVIGSFKINPHILENEIFTETELNKISMNRNNRVFQYEINKWSLFINEFCKLKNVKILFWGICDQQAYFFLNLWNFNESKSVNRILDQFPYSGDNHFSIFGHQNFADKVIESLSNLDNFEYQSTYKFLKMKRFI